MEDIKKNVTSKKKCKNIPIVSHDANGGILSLNGGPDAANEI